MIFKMGDTGNGVAVVQFALNNLTSFTPLLKTDGIFGPRTKERVIQHQRGQNLVPDGIVGPVTLETLFDVVEMSIKSKFRNIEPPVSGRSAGAGLAVPNGSFIPPFRGTNAGAPGGSFIPPFRPSGGGSAPNLTLPGRPGGVGNLQSPSVAEFLRHQQAFWKWFNEPHPKSPVPQPKFVVVPVPGPFGPVHLPVAEQVIPLQGPPAKNGSAKAEAGAEGGVFTFSIKADASVDVAKLKFKEATYGIGLDWVVLKGRIAKIELSPSVVRDHDGETSVEVEATIKGGSGLTLKQKLGSRAELQVLPYLATAVSSELSMQAKGGVKASIEINIAKVRGVGMKAEVGVGAGPKISYGPVKQPDGREEHQVTVVPFGATGFIGIGGEF